MTAIPRIRDFEDRNFDPFLAEETVFGMDLVARHGQSDHGGPGS